MMRLFMARSRARSRCSDENVKTPGPLIKTATPGLGDGSTQRQGGTHCALIVLAAIFITGIHLGVAGIFERCSKAEPAMREILPGHHVAYQLREVQTAA